MRLAAIAFAVAVMAPIVALAEVSAPAQARYETKAGWSDWHKVQMTFMKGAELNKATRSISYSAWDSYGTIFFAPGQAAVIRFDSMLSGCSSEFTASCLPRFGNMTGGDQDGTKWEVCTQRFC